MGEAINVVANVKLGKVDTSELTRALDVAIKAAATGATGGKAAVSTKDIERVFTSQSTAALMTYGKIESGLNKALKEMTDKMTGSMKGVGLAGADAAGIGTILQLVLGEALDEIVSILQSIVKLLLMLSGIGEIGRAHV